MLGKITKVLLGVYLILLVLVIVTDSESFGFDLLFGVGFFVLVTSIFVTKDIRKLKNSLTSRIGSVLLVNIILYSTVILFYGLSGIGTGDKGLMAIFVFVLYSIFFGISSIVAIIIVLNDKSNKHGILERKLNKILFLITIIIGFMLFYTVIISGLANLFQMPGICSAHIEIQDDSFVFQKGREDYCVSRISINQKNYDTCENDRCIELVAINNTDLSGCNKIKGDQTYCVQGVVYRMLNTEERVKLGIKPEIDTNICDDLGEQESKGLCLKEFAFELEDINFCLEGNIFLNCFDELANVKNNGDESQCELLTSPAKGHCINYVNSKTLKSYPSRVPTELRF